MSRIHWPPRHTENRKNLIIRRKAIRKLWTLQYKVKCKVAGLLVISSFSSFSCWVELLSPRVRHLKIRTFPSVHVTRCLELSQPSASLLALIIHELVKAPISGSSQWRVLRRVRWRYSTDSTDSVAARLSNWASPARERAAVALTSVCVFPGNLSKTCTADGWTEMRPFDIAVNCGYNLNSTSDDVSKQQSPQEAAGRRPNSPVVNEASGTERARLKGQWAGRI